MLETEIFTITSEIQFQEIALKVFQFQYKNVPVYRRFCDYLNVSPNTITSASEIPFLPIEFFKSKIILSEKIKSEVTFTSSGTTGAITSKHYVASLEMYEKSFTIAFKNVYGSLEDFTILALLPSYLERGGSSLVYMVNALISKTHNEHSGFYLNDTDALIRKIEFLESQKKPTLLIGVSYALLDLIEKKKFNLNHTIVMETGGMKGRRKELIKAELHNQLKKGFGLTQIHSEYGMTELLSQAYLTTNENFVCPPWMKVFTRDPNDPLSLIQAKTGGINIIDLANLYSCSFIATQDLGKVNTDGSFQILGRFDTSDIRGCNLMVF